MEQLLLFLGHLIAIMENNQREDGSIVIPEILVPYTGFSVIKQNNMSKTYIIGEIGTSHNGYLEKARDLIFTAKECGADCAKFQVVFANEIIHPNTGLVNLPTVGIFLYTMYLSP
jgi:hypothetical protein